MSAKRPARILPPKWLLVLLVIPAGLIAWLQFSDGAGDEGMNNVFCYMAVLFGAAVYGLWFLFGSGQRPGVKLVALAAVGATLAALFFLTRLEGWTGAMVPLFRWAWESPDQRIVEVGETARPAAAVDLVSTTAADFPGYLGARRDAVVRGVGLARDWSTTPPELLWRISVGTGWSGFAVVNGVAITHEDSDGEEHVVARSVATGDELWRHSYPAGFDHPLGGPGPRATPTVDAGHVYTQGALGMLVCLDGAGGSLAWNKDLRALYGMTDELEAELVQYGRSGSPLVHGELLIVPVGGDPAGQRAGLVAFEKHTGEVRWEGPPRSISHSSPVIASLCGVEQVLIVNQDTVSGHDPEDGALLWEHPWPGSTAADANNSQPVAVGDAGVLVSKGYGQGSALLELARTHAGVWSVSERWAQRRSLRTKLTNAVVRGAHAYALSDGMPECVALADGKRVWKEGRFGHGQLLLVDDLLLVLSEEGELVLVEASPEGEGVILGRFPVLAGKTWNTFALYGDLALVRNGSEAAAVRLPTVGG